MEKIEKLKIVLLTFKFSKQSTNFTSIRKPQIVIVKVLNMSYIFIHISDSLLMDLMQTQSITSQIWNRIKAMKAGSIVSAPDFLDLARRDAIDQALVRLRKKGAVRRIATGLYELPKQSIVLGTLSPDPIKIAKAWAEKKGATLLPSGAYAAFSLGLTMQIPSEIEFISNTRAKSFSSGSLTVSIKTGSSQKMAVANRVSGLVFQALRYLGAKQIDDEVIEKLRKKVDSSEINQIWEDRRYAPVWMHEFLEQLITKK